MKKISVRIVLGVLFLVFCILFLCIVVLTDRNESQVSEKILIAVHGEVMTEEAVDSEVADAVSDEASPQEVNLSWTCDLQTELFAFLGADTLDAKSVAASRIIRTMISQPKVDRVDVGLAEATGALVGASGADAPEVATSIVNAAGTSRTDMVVSAIAIAASFTPNPEEVHAAVIQAVPEDSKESARSILSQKKKPMSQEFQETVLHAAKGFKLIYEKWDAEKGMLKRDLFADYDDGETPCPRGTGKR